MLPVTLYAPMVAPAAFKLSLRLPKAASVPGVTPEAKVEPMTLPLPTVIEVNVGAAVGSPTRSSLVAVNVPSIIKLGPIS